MGARLGKINVLDSESQIDRVLSENTITSGDLLGMPALYLRPRIPQNEVSRMELQQVESSRQRVEHGGFTRAGAALHLSQSTVSQHNWNMSWAARSFCESANEWLSARPERCCCNIPKRSFAI